MQAVILAAGKSTRTYPLTLTKPKPLLEVAGKTILEHNLDAIKQAADEIIIVAGYKKSMIEKFIKKKYPKLKISFVEQKKQLGTGHAVMILKKHIKGRFLLLMGDNIYSKDDVKKIASYRYSILAERVKNPENFGVIVEKNNLLIDIIEKPKKFISDLVSCALYSLDTEIFTFLENAKKSERNEYELPDAIREISKKDKVHCIKTSSCLQISYPWDLLAADQRLRKNKNIIGKNSKISGSVKNSSIGNNCIIKGDIKNSIVMDNTSIGENSVVEYSVMGENVRFSGIAKSSKRSVSMVKGRKVSAGVFGAIIGDNSTLIDVELSPGCKISPGRKIKGIKIENDV
jgi:UDP-N-acetylglucosamine diphosphorylase / glucose-1-phosphate thymidylyltransferase / UDP-N-acetylgalactosamine diphosphorylase / glucosamine-1-phosphate N-acetyltransferase / galactosamine-1-phosphate N-acetyltransferase